MKNYKVKVCGITDEKNYMDLSRYPIDYFGFIFYNKSPRYVSDDCDFIKDISNKIAVFVNEDINQILHIVKEYNFSMIQLHGNESPQYCNDLKKMSLRLIKSFLINNESDFNDINLYSNSVDYFLFDYKSKKYGGSGKSFDWSILNKIKISKPFFLSGGISLENINKIASLYDNRFLHAVDINSKFEKYPGFKDVKLIDKFYNLNL
jgi:phosphoribosylanthranilate isomerase|tara:strand:+ start:1809 stop:2426 length:618 start_codon:yes stop_codon:yes gene_type:complete